MKKTLITLGLCAFAASVFSGCATQKTRTGRNNTFLGGALAVNTGYYQPPAPTTVDVDGTQLFGRVNPSGDQVKLLWGLVTYTDY
jgi:hypothetical protein